MESERWTRLRALFHQAVDLAQPERDAFLLGNSADDPSLVADVKALLDEDARSDFILDRGLDTFAANMLEHGEATPSGSFGPYRMVRRLGEGGMGVVYLAERKDIGAIAAIKILRDASLSPARRERFASEQRLLAQLSHPVSVELIDLRSISPWDKETIAASVSKTGHRTSLPSA